MFATAPTPMKDADLKFSPAAVDSQLNAEDIVKMDMFIYYACCGGCALGKMGEPYCEMETKELCFHSTAMCDDLMTEKDGLCSMMTVSCCVTEHCQCPPLKGAPMCALFGKEFVPGDGSIDREGDEITDDYNALFADTWFCIYVGCMGMGCHAIGASKRPLFGALEKMLCIRGETDFSFTDMGIDKDGTMCASVGTQFCCWHQCQFPINKHKMPCCACPCQKVMYYDVGM